MQECSLDLMGVFLLGRQAICFLGESDCFSNSLKQDFFSDQLKAFLFFNHKKSHSPNCYQALYTSVPFHQNK